MEQSVQLAKGQRPLTTAVRAMWATCQGEELKGAQEETMCNMSGLIVSSSLTGMYWVAGSLAVGFGMVVACACAALLCSSLNKVNVGYILHTVLLLLLLLLLLVLLQGTDDSRAASRASRGRS